MCSDLLPFNNPLFGFDHLLSPFSRRTFNVQVNTFLPIDRHDVSLKQMIHKGVDMEPKWCWTIKDRLKHSTLDYML